MVMYLCFSLSVSEFLNLTPLAVTGSGAHGPVVFELPLDREDLEMENHDEKSNCSSWQYLSFGTNLIDLRHLEVYL